MVQSFKEWHDFAAHELLGRRNHQGFIANKLFRSEN
jgi:hypothetical protein